MVNKPILECSTDLIASVDEGRIKDAYNSVQTGIANATMGAANHVGVGTLSTNPYGSIGSVLGKGALPLAKKAKPNKRIALRKRR